jgi:hypothetical protein
LSRMLEVPMRKLSCCSKPPSTVPLFKGMLAFQMQELIC